MEERKIQDTWGQPRGIESGRMLRHALLAAWIPMGNGIGGAGRKYIMTMWLTHYLGRFLFPVLIRYEHSLHMLYAWLRRMRGQ